MVVTPPVGRLLDVCETATSSSPSSGVGLFPKDDRPDATPNIEAGLCDELSLQQDKRGRFYYSYSSDSGPQEIRSASSSREFPSLDALGDEVEHPKLSNYVSRANHQGKADVLSSHPKVNDDVPGFLGSQALKHPNVSCSK